MLIQAAQRANASELFDFLVSDAQRIGKYDLVLVRDVIYR